MLIVQQCSRHGGCSLATAITAYRGAEWSAWQRCRRNVHIPCTFPSLFSTRQPSCRADHCQEKLGSSQALFSPLLGCSLTYTWQLFLHLVALRPAHAGQLGDSGICAIHSALWTHSCVPTTEPVSVPSMTEAGQGKHADVCVSVCAG